jgi:predicted amidophosphoribosyltransferase
VLAVVAYDDLCRRILLRAKIGGRRELLRPIADRMVACLRPSRFHLECDVVAPIPSHPWTDLLRGFSPPTDLARRVSRAMGIPFRPGLIRRRVMVRGTAKRMAAAERAALAARAFRVSGRVCGRSVLLIDDVMTTGSSLEACSTLLKRAGAREVRALVWARKL